MVSNDADVGVVVMAYIRMVRSGGKRGPGCKCVVSWGEVEDEAEEEEEEVREQICEIIVASMGRGNPASWKRLE